MLVDITTRVKRLSTVSQSSIEGCQLVYIHSSARAPSASLLQTNLPILWVTEEGAGGEIRFVIKEQRIKFAINLKKARDKGIKISSRLLKLAVSVEQ